jgi:hypothetical protein
MYVHRDDFSYMGDDPAIWSFANIAFLILIVPQAIPSTLKKEHRVCMLYRKDRKI